MDPFAHCGALLRAQDEDRWLAARYAPLESRRRLLALAAVRLEIARVPAQVREAPLGEIRLQWWREGLAVAATGRPPPHPALEAVAAIRPDKEAIGALVAAIDAQARLLYGDPFASAEELTDWLYLSEAFLAVQSARLIGGPGPDLDAVKAAALAYALARVRPRMAGDLQAHIKAKAQALLDGVRRAAPFPPAVMPALAYLALASAYLRPKGLGPLERRLVIFRAIARGRL